jgi:hypothetical protein
MLLAINRFDLFKLQKNTEFYENHMQPVAYYLYLIVKIYRGIY